MITNYIEAAMSKATYEKFDEDGTYYGEIPEFSGVYANEHTLEACRQDLQSALEDWIVLGLRLGHRLPVIDGIDLNYKTEEVA